MSWNDYLTISSYTLKSRIKLQRHQKDSQAILVIVTVI